MRRFIARWASTLLLSSFATGVGQPARSCFVLSDESVSPASLYVSVAGDPAIGVGHPLCDPEESVSDMRRPDATSREIDGPKAIADLRQRTAYSGEPDTP